MELEKDDNISHNLTCFSIYGQRYDAREEQNQ